MAPLHRSNYRAVVKSAILVCMRSLSRLISRWLLLVMLATVFAPSFAWEATQGMASHNDTVVAHGGHGDEHPASDDVACDGCVDHDKHCDDIQHLCCPGHVLGHLPGNLPGRLSLLVPEVAHAAVDRLERLFSSRIPEGLERPPKGSVA